MAVIDRRADRGQLLVITALSLALLITLMALALNTAVFGEVHVAQTDDNLNEEREAVQYEDDVQRGIGGLLPAYRDRSNIDESILEAEFESDITDWSEMTGREYGHDGVVTNVTVDSVTPGTFILQDDKTRSFTSAGGSASWTVADNMNQIVAYEMNVTDEQLAPRDESFHVIVGDWEMAIYEQSGGIVIEVDDNMVCETDSPFVPIDLEKGSFGVADCPDEFETFQDELDPPYTLEYTNATQVSGTYELGFNGTVESSNYHDPGSAQSPRSGPSIIAANVTVRYRSAGLAYERRLRIPPGEANG